MRAVFARVMLCWKRVVDKSYMKTTFLVFIFDISVLYNCVPKQEFQIHEWEERIYIDSFIATRIRIPNKNWIPAFVTFEDMTSRSETSSPYEIRPLIVSFRCEHVLYTLNFWKCLFWKWIISNNFLQLSNSIGKGKGDKKFTIFVHRKLSISN